MIEQGDLFSGEALRDAGIQLVSANNEDWMLMARLEARRFVMDKLGGFIGEDIRFHVREKIGEPKHPNAWGALGKALLESKIIQPTGRHTAMKDRSSHARQTPVYVRGQNA
jgi:hypothetical protein